MFDILKAFAPRAVQDIITAIAGVLVSHGVVTADQEQSFIGAAFFLAMLVVNYLIANKRKADAAQIGALTTGNYLTRSDALSIAKKGKAP